MLTTKSHTSIPIILGESISWTTHTSVTTDIFIFRVRINDAMKPMLSSFIFIRFFCIIIKWFASVS